MRLIDADALTKEIKMDIEDVGLQERKIFYRINDAPTIDAVEVVRCKDCRHRDLFSCHLTDNDFQKDEDYCSWGERKGGESDG